MPTQLRVLGAPRIDELLEDLALTQDEKAYLLHPATRGRLSQLRDADPVVDEPAPVVPLRAVS